MGLLVHSLEQTEQNTDDGPCADGASTFPALHYIPADP